MNWNRAEIDPEREYEDGERFEFELELLDVNPLLADEVEARALEGLELINQTLAQDAPGWSFVLIDLEQKPVFVGKAAVVLRVRANQQGGWAFASGLAPLPIIPLVGWVVMGLLGVGGTASVYWATHPSEKTLELADKGVSATRALALASAAFAAVYLASKAT
jgi:hypothetical protein